MAHSKGNAIDEFIIDGDCKIDHIWTYQKGRYELSWTFGAIVWFKWNIVNVDNAWSKILIILILFY